MTDLQKFYCTIIFFELLSSNYILNSNKQIKVMNLNVPSFCVSLHNASEKMFSCRDRTKTCGDSEHDVLIYDASTFARNGIVDYKMCRQGGFDYIQYCKLFPTQNLKWKKNYFNIQNYIIYTRISKYTV